MKTTLQKSNRIIGLDMHPDVFAAAAIEKTSADISKTLWVQDRLCTAHLESWAKKQLQEGDLLVLEASGASSRHLENSLIFWLWRFCGVIVV